MIGGEAAEMAALARPGGGGEAPSRDPHGLGWVMDWLYGDAVLPPLPLPSVTEPEPLPRRRYAVPAHEPAALAASKPSRVRTRRRTRQLALL